MLVNRQEDRYKAGCESAQLKSATIVLIGVPAEEEERIREFLPQSQFFTASAFAMAKSHPLWWEFETAQSARQQHFVQISAPWRWPLAL